MSTGEGTDGENGRANPGFVDPLRADDHGRTSDNYSHGGHGRNQHTVTDWKKIANENYEDFLSRCPAGTYAGNEQPNSGSQAIEHCDTSLNVCYLQ